MSSYVITLYSPYEFCKIGWGRIWRREICKGCIIYATSCDGRLESTQYVHLSLSRSILNAVPLMAIIAFIHKMSLITYFSYFRSWMVLCQNWNKEHLTSWFLRRSNNNTPYRILEGNSILTTEIFCFRIKDISWYLCTYSEDKNLKRY